MKFKSCCTYCLFISGIVFLITSIVLLVMWPYLYFRVLSNELILTPTSASYELWHDIPIPMYLELYLFNFTNTEEVAANHNVKPHFEQLGPYVFRERHKKVNQSWFSNSTVSFFQRRTWTFEPNMSNGSLSDKVTNINVIMSTVAHYLKGTSSFIMGALSQFLVIQNQSIFITKTAEELLFEGYEDYILDWGKNMSGINIPSIQLPEIPFDKFGWFYGRNNSDTYDGEFNMFTGADDINKLGVLNLWNKKSKTGFYGDGCDEITGTTGELWPPNTDVDNVTIFASDICGTLNLKHKGEMNVDGIKGSFFVGDESVFDNGWNYPDKECFCPNGTICTPAGTRNVSLCQFGAPAFISFPHFYLANESYLDAIEGLSPNRDDHEFRLILEQNIGIPLLVRAQLQINVLVENVPGFQIINNHMPEKFVPMLWFRQEIRLTDEYASQAKMILNLSTGVNIALYCILSISIVAILTAVALFVARRLRRDPERQFLVEDN